jgi:DNA repair photolyase
VNTTTTDTKHPLDTPGRGALDNPPSRYEKLHVVLDSEWPGELPSRAPTEFFEDRSKSILSKNDSPDIGFDVSINPYRGCEHGCVYCYARPTHEYLGLSAGLDFETKVFVKRQAAEMLRTALGSPSWKPQMIQLSGVTDPYQPVEKRLLLTRACLEVLVDFRNPASVVTKNHLITRDIDLLAELAAVNAVSVSISITTLNNSLHRKMEPRTSTPERRLQAIRRLTAAGIPVSLLVAPLIPGLTDHELSSIVEAAAAAGATAARYQFIRLPLGLKTLFERWLRVHYPKRCEKVVNQIRRIRGGKLSDARFFSRMTGSGEYALQVKALFAASCRKAGIRRSGFELATKAFRRTHGRQPSLPF